jgi:NDP-sugar pyrophosphorylase family protein
MLHPADLFQIQSWKYADLFDGVTYVWEVLPRIKDYILAHLKPGIDGLVKEGAWLEGDDIQIGRGTVVEPGALIHGPVIIGCNCEIRQGAYIRGQALVGDGCVVGHTTEMKNSVMLDGAKAGHFAYIGDSILGRDVNLGAGTKLANLKINGSAVTVRHEGRVHDTGLRKFGAILGDGVELGCNSVSSPGTIVGPQTLVYPIAAVAGVIPARSIVKLKQSQEIHPRRIRD